MRGAALVAAAGLLAYGAWRLRADEAAAAAPADASPGVLDAVEGAIVSRLQLWRAPAQYADLVAAAEARHGIPAGMLERLLWQESRWRADIIDGRTRSSVGAVGIAQFMPATAAEMGIDPLDVPQAINAAGAYLARLFARLGSWARALAAYNWGIGNVLRRGLDAAPAETRNYFTSIMADVNAAAGTAYA